MNKKLMIMSALLLTMGLNIETSSATVMGNSGWDGKIPAWILREHGLSENIATSTAQQVTSHTTDHVKVNPVSPSIPPASPIPPVSPVSPVRSASPIPPTLVPKWGLIGIGATTVIGAGMLYKYNKSNQDEKVKKERLAHRSYFEKTYESISDFAKSAKINTWDSNYGFNHSGKVITVASAAAAAGLLYGAYQAYQNGYFSKMKPVW